MTSEEEFRAGLRLAMQLAWQRHATVADNGIAHSWKCACGEWDQFDGLDDHQWSAVIDAALAFRFPDHPEGPRVAVVGEQVGCIDELGHLAELADVRSDEDYRARYYGKTGRIEPEPKWTPVVTLYPATPETP